MNNYRGSKKRAFILLTNLAIVVYTLLNGDGRHNFIGYGLLVIIAISMYDYWRNVDET